MAVAAIAFGATVAVFGAGSGRLGFYSDDAGFLTTLPHEGFVATLRSAKDYVPGRNLHIIWQQLLFLVGGHGPSDLGTLHLIQSVLDGLTIAVFYLLLRNLTLPAVWALVGTALFAFYPNHGETHYWLSSGPMNVVSTLFLLGFAYAATSAIRRTARGEPVPRRLLAAELLLFVLALFTYDQTFFVLFFVLAVRAAQLLEHRARPAASVVAAGGGYAAATVFYLVLKRHPQSGPTLTHVDIAHALDNARLSLRETIGDIFRIQTNVLLQQAGDQDRLAGAACAIGLGALALALVVWMHRRAAASGLVILPWVGLVFAGVACFFLAYLPVYVWYISPRHNFLPTAGLGLTAAALGATFSSTLSRYVDRFAGEFFAALAAVGVAYAVFFLVTADLTEKRFWADAYRLRVSMYASLIAQHRLDGRSAIVFENFPAALGPAPFFGQENQLAVAYLYPGRTRLGASSLSAIEAPQGYFLYTEIDRYGVALRYLPRGKVARLVYRSQTPNRIVLSATNNRYRADRFYSVSRLGAAAGGRSGELVRSAVVRAGPKRALIVDLDLARIRIRRDEELGLLLYGRNGPFITRNTYHERMLVPIALEGGGEATARKPQRFRVLLGRSAPADLSKVDVYDFGSGLPRLLASAPIAG